MQAERQEKIKATIPVPDHSDLRGFSYRAPTNIQGYNDNPKLKRPNSRLKGQLYHRKGFWTSLRDFFLGKKEPSERPLSPELVNTQAGGSKPRLVRSQTDENFSSRPYQERPLPQDRDASPIWPG